MPYFGDAYMADTRHLTLEEHGAYHLLLLIAWRSPDCTLPDDDRRLAQMLGVTARKWAALKPVIMGFWTLAENGWEQKRLTKERRWVEEKSRKNKGAAEQRWGAKSQETKGTDNANASANGCADVDANGYAPPPPPGSNEPVVSSKDDSPSDDEPSLRPEHVFESYQELAADLGLPIPRDFTPERRQLVRGRIAQYSLADFQTVMARCRGSPFLRGDKGRTPLTFDWLMQKKNFQKVLEGTSTLLDRARKPHSMGPGADEQRRIPYAAP
jgi:uncharacterized protein YdaU (DUF1376 family)